MPRYEASSCSSPSSSSAAAADVGAIRCIGQTSTQHPLTGEGLGLCSRQIPGPAAAVADSCCDGEAMRGRARPPTVCELIDFLRIGDDGDADTDADDSVQLNAAAYLQHLSYKDDETKAIIRSLDGIAVVVKVIARSSNYDIQRAACGLLRNLTCGRNGPENKRAIASAGGITQLVRLLDGTTSTEMMELVTGILWNLSSSSDLKKNVTDDCLPVVVSKLIVPFAEDLVSGVRNHDTVDAVNQNIFINATGILRNVSSDSALVRHRLRSSVGLVEASLAIACSAAAASASALIPTTSTTTTTCSSSSKERWRCGVDGLDGKLVENVICLLRNLSYACNVEDQRTETESTNHLLSQQQHHKQKMLDAVATRRPRGQTMAKTKKSNNVQDDVDVGCFCKRNSRRINQSTQRTYDCHPTKMTELLWQPEVTKIYVPLLASCSNVDTLEAALGAIQNLTADCYGQASEEIRESIRKEKGLPIIIDLLTSGVTDGIVRTAATALRNLALNERNRDLIGRYGLHQLSSKLPPSSSSHFPPLLQETISAVEAAIYELLKANVHFARSFMDLGGIWNLMAIVQSEGASRDYYSLKVVLFAHKILEMLWKYEELREEFRQRGWKRKDFLRQRPAILRSKHRSSNLSLGGIKESYGGCGAAGGQGDIGDEDVRTSTASAHYAAITSSISQTRQLGVALPHQRHLPPLYSPSSATYQPPSSITLQTYPSVEPVNADQSAASYQKDTPV